MREFRARSRFEKRVFFYEVLLVALVWLCGFFAGKCGKANKSSHKCAVSIGMKYGGATTGARFLEKTIREASGNSEFLRDFLLSWRP